MTDPYRFILIRYNRPMRKLILPIVFLLISPTPAGIGFVEGFLTLGLRSLNVPLDEATVVTLAYRGVTFWVPLLFGMLAFRWLSHVDEVPAVIVSE